MTKIELAVPDRLSKIDPDHKHIDGKPLPSKDKLIDVFKYIAGRLRSN